jgi:hypothetical protein
MKMSDTEKIIIDLGSVKIDLLFEGGHYSTCEHCKCAEVLPQEEKPSTQSSFGIGAFYINSTDLEKYKSRHERVKINAVGLFSLASDISPTLAMEVVESIKVYGIFQAQSDVKSALMQTGRIS